MMMSKVDDLARIESNGITHQYTGKRRRRVFVMIGMNVVEMKYGEPIKGCTIEIKSLKNFSLLFKQFQVDSLFEFGAEKYLVSNLIIESWSVIKELSMPAEIDQILSP